MSEEEKFYLLLGAGAVYAPFFVAASGRHGGGVWKFLSFCFCTFAVVLPIMDTFEEVLPVIAFISSPILLGLGIISWSFAWIFAVVARSVSGESPLKMRL
jgi:hypothetical protein